jgi:FtsH-binding integral membrane protein
MRKLLLGVLVVGFAARVSEWGDEGVVAWIGGTLMVIAAVGLMASQFLRDRRRWAGKSFYFDPYWKWGLVAILLVTLLVQGISGAAPPLSSFLAALFWIVLIMLLVQTIGRWILRWRHRGTSPTKEADAK